MNRKECRQAMLADLKALKVEPEKTDFFITHLHADHSGLSEYLPHPLSRVYMGALDACILNNSIGESRWLYLCEKIVAHGLPEGEAEEAYRNFPGRIYGPHGHVNVTPIEDGDELNIGDYHFNCIMTPGHTPGHMCLYDASKNILICGDHILNNVTPNITFWPEVEDSLAQYLTSLDKTYNLDVRLVMPGHRTIFEDLRRRVTELKEHHQSRLKEIIKALEDGKKTAFQVAPHVSWDINYPSWDKFPPLQKWFAMGETLAHLTHLELAGVVQSNNEAGKILFSLA
jgi:glyoxylase-like metal-dependent hydrolase (beta-lactamase superfamily II)